MANGSEVVMDVDNKHSTLYKPPNESAYDTRAPFIQKTIGDTKQPSIKISVVHGEGEQTKQKQTNIISITAALIYFSFSVAAVVQSIRCVDWVELSSPMQIFQLLVSGMLGPFWWIWYWISGDAVCVKRAPLFQ